MPPLISIIIPNWNGEAFIARCVAATVQSAQSSGYSHEILVLDDASSDKSPDMVARDFPMVSIRRNASNMGFGATVNHGAEIAQGEFLILLNNDLVPKEAMVGELMAPIINNENVFGVTGRILEWDGTSPNHLNMRVHWTAGEFRVGYTDPADVQPTMFLLGGCCVVRRNEFRRLGGLCPLFSPGYWEDYDISYLAMKAGWKNVYSPRAQAYHFGQGSMVRAYGNQRLNIIKERNAYLFTWLNITDDRMLRQHASRLPSMAFRALSSRKPEQRARLQGLLKALPYLKRAREERLRRHDLLRRTDAEIQSEFGMTPTDAGITRYAE